MIVEIIDETAAWSVPLATACERWNLALTSRGISVQWFRGNPSAAPIFGTPTDGRIHVSDHALAIAGHWADSWEWDSGAWPGGWVHCYGSPPGTEFAVAIVVHELGHCLGLKHGTGDTVMTPYPHLAYPSASDAAGAMPGYPLPSPQPSPPAPVHHDKKDKHHKKHH